MAKNAILEAIKTSTLEERQVALTELLSIHAEITVPLVKNGQPMSPLTESQRSEISNRLSRRKRALDIEDVIADYSKRARS